MATITKRSQLTGVQRTLSIPQYTSEEFERLYVAYSNGRVLLEDAFPDLKQSTLHFIKTGITEEEMEYFVGKQ